MADPVIYVSFKDTFSDKNPDSLKIAAENLADQILAAAKRIEQNRKAIDGT